MFLNILKFELQYRAKRPATYIYFGIMFLLAFGAIAWENLTVGGGTGQVKENAPTVISFMMVILTAIPGFFLCSAVMGVPVLRDFQHKTDSMIFTTRINKRDYLFGRFIGSFMVILFIYLGMMLGLALGGAMPWLDEEKMLPYNFYHFVQPFFLFVLPNAFITGALFFAGGTLSRKLLFVFLQGAMLLVLYIVTSNFAGELDNRTLAALLDPVGINLVNVVSQYWTVAERNTMLYSFSGLVMINRLIWVGIAILVLVGTYFGFNFNVVGNGKWGKFFRRKHTKVTPVAQNLKVDLPQVTLHEGWETNITRILNLSRLYFKEIFRSIPFLAIVLFGIIMLIVDGIEFSSMYGTDVYPTTYTILNAISGFNIFFVILIVFYSGELVWRERDIRMNQIYDALPVPNFVGLASKFLGLTYVHILLLVVLMITGILIQMFKGYFQFEIPVYLTTLFTDTFFFLIMLSLLSFFVQVLVNQKFLGHALVILFFMINLFVLGEMGLEHRMFRFGNVGLGTYSDMNVYGHYVAPFSWFSLYWFGFSFLLFGAAVLFAMRGTNTILKTRLKLARLRFSRPIILFMLAALVLFAGSGCFIFYNTNVINEYQNSDEQKELQARYEKELKQYQTLPQPKIVDTYLEVDIFPSSRDFDVRGHYILKNKTQQPIEHIHIQQPSGEELHTELLTFERMDSLGAGNTAVLEAFPDFKYSIYKLDRPLMAGDSLKMNFASHFRTTGFVESGSNTSVVFNGTFFNNSFFPSLGYDRGFELGGEDDRKEQDLPERERMRERNDPVGQTINLVGDDADHIRFEIIVSTEPEQIAIAPGYLKKEWQEEGRKYYHYKMDVPMFNFYNIVSARYEVLKEMWRSPDGRDIELSIYYHEGHEYNLDRMMEAMKKSLAYYTIHFSPYQYRQMRIMEFPRYRSFAQSFANTVPFSEGIGFVLDIDEDDVDIAYYVTAHEMAHQWWGHQVTEAQVKGNAMLSETMSQYSALMVMKQKYPPEMMQKFLKYELDRYLRGRATESKKEQPLEFVEGQGYIHYRKGSLIMYALQDYISEDSVNAALKRYTDDWAWRTDRYVTTDILLDYFREVTPDSLQYLIKDFFQTITLFENRTGEATYTRKGDQYQVDLEVSAIKYRADSLGNETPVQVNDWIDVGVYGETKTGKDTLLYLQKHKINEENIRLKIDVDQLPTKAGIDPINKLIDRNPDDNVKTLTSKDSS